MTGEPGESMIQMLFQTVFFPCYKNNREESYCPYIMSVNGGQNRA